MSLLLVAQIALSALAGTVIALVICWLITPLLNLLIDSVDI